MIKNQDKESLEESEEEDASFIARITCRCCYFPKLSAFLLLRQKIVALLLPPPPYLLAVKQKATPSALRLSVFSFLFFKLFVYLVLLFHKFIDIIAIHLESPDLGQRWNVIEYRLHMVCRILQHSPTKALFKEK
ncbi:hypothetical protein AVEN_258215-1 [Araneus ventricosus]|uniref:Uncharacterized protein n=1 Tax=Araneus ventricosus TaxID=182803 RepID=A0A4Y2MS72_ARAVE|nr:hypothetical protein AVEN_258215-1 [Araneus ventricosus]